MTEQHKNKLTVLADDTVMIEALKSAFGEVLAANMPNVSETADNSLIGAKYRAYEAAKTMLAEAFANIEGLRKGRDNNINFNKAY